MKLNPLERWFVNSPMRRAMQALVVRWFRAAAPLGPGADIIEIGGGGGGGARLLARHFQPRRIILSDLDLRMVALARRQLAERAPAPVHLCVADASRLPFRRASADAVFGFGVLHHVPAWRDALAEVVRVLKPGGVYGFEEYYPSLYRNVLTRRLAAHPAEDRFESHDLRWAFGRVGLDLRCALDLRRFGILGVGLKKAAGVGPAGPDRGRFSPPIP